MMPTAGGHRAVRTIVFVCSVAASVAVLSAQDRAPRFEAVTIKPQSDIPAARAPQSPTLFSRDFITLQQLIIYAYGVLPHRIIGGPSWITSDRFQVMAKASSPPTRAQMQALVQDVLIERFGLKLHRETRDLQTYDLVMARADRRPGPNLKPAGVDCSPFRNGERPIAESPLVPDGRGGTRPRCVHVVGIGGGLRTSYLSGVPLTELITTIESTVNRSVIDKTGLTGLFDIELKHTDDSQPPAFRGKEPAEGPTLFTALTEQLGLKLESSRHSIEVLVIDSARTPDPD